MSDASNANNNSSPIGWLLLRDGHAVPLLGLAPEQIKASSKGTVLAPEIELKHRRRLTAIVDTLGFKGDFGDYERRGWPEFLQFLAEHRCTTHRPLFPRGFGHIFFDLQGPRRRQLADRVYLGPQPAPRRVFLGAGVDWDAWWDRATHIRPRPHGPWDLEFQPRDREGTIQWLLERRLDFAGQWGFLDDKLVDVPGPSLVDKTYFTDPAKAPVMREESLALLRVLVRAFRFVFDAQAEGWVDVLPFNHALTVLRGYDGAWDVIWRDLREGPPPGEQDEAGWYGLSVLDRPAILQGEEDLASRLYFRRAVWDEHEAHVAEQHFYDRGGTPAERRRLSGDGVRRIYLIDTDAWPRPARSAWHGAPPSGFRWVQVGELRMLVSELVTVGEFQRMLAETDYLERRPEGDDPWERANDAAPASAPVGATWHDAQAYCAWLERTYHVVARLLTPSEHRALRPFFSGRYAQLARQDFPWEEFPPRPLEEHLEGAHVRRVEVPSAVTWSEPRFVAPGADTPEFPDDNGVATGSRKRWIADFPPRAFWMPELPWVEHGGLRFIDAWDAYEWCQDWGWIAGRFWEGPIAVSSWGAYKNVKVGFRVVLDVEES